MAFLNFQVLLPVKYSRVVSLESSWDDHWLLPSWPHNSLPHMSLDKIITIQLL